MSRDYYDYADEIAEEEYREEVINEARDEIISEFQDERLTSFYERHEGLEVPAVSFLHKAQAVVDVDSTAAFVRAYAASEYIVKKVILEPIVAGFIHDDNVDEIIAPMVMKDKEFLNLLFSILKKYDVDLDSEAFGETGRTIKQEWHRQRLLRNGAVHRCQEVDREDAELAIKLASLFYHDIMVRLFTVLGIRYSR